jgi:autotransporter passenger strand-loop-strand repeat protein
MIVSSGGAVEDTSVADGAVLVVSAGETLGTTLSGFHAFPGGPARRSTEHVLSGGVASDTTIGAFGELFVGEGGTADGTTVNAGGYLLTRGGEFGGGVASANDLLVSGRGAVANLQSSTIASGCVVADGGTLKLGSFPFVSDITDTTVSSGGRLVLSRDCSASNTVILAGGVEILKEGFDYGVTVASGGRIVGDPLARLIDATISGGGSVVLKELSFASAVEVLNSGHLTLEGSFAEDLTITRGATVVVEGGSVEGSLSMSAGGLIVRSSGVAFISSGISTTGGIVGSGGDVVVLPGGATADLTVLSGGEIEYAGGAVKGLVIRAGATEIVESKAIVSNLHHPGVDLVVSSGGTVRGAKVQSAALTVSSGGAVIDAYVQSGMLTVSSGGTISDVTLQSASETVFSDGRALGRTTFAQSSTVQFDAKTGILLMTSGFDATDTIDLAAFQLAGSQLSIVTSGATTQVTVTNRLQQANIILFGQYSAAGFHLSRNGAGTALTYDPPADTVHELAAGHKQ